MYQVWLKSLDIYLSYHPKNENMSRADNSVKIWWNLPKPDLHNINAHTKFGENPLTFTQVIIRKWKYGRVVQIIPQKFDDICPLAIPNQISTMSMHIPSLVKIHWCLLKLSSGTEKTDGWTTDGWTDRHKDVQHETIIPRHYRVAGYENTEVSKVFWARSASFSQ